MIALLSKISIQKDGPTKERTLALNMGKERKIDFLIPLLLEPLSPSELDWMMSDITNIPFNQGWAIGLQQLVQKLDKIQTPQSLNNSFAAAAESLLPKNVLDVRQETLHSNTLRVQRIPEVIKRFVLQETAYARRRSCDIAGLAILPGRSDYSTCLPATPTNALQQINNNASRWRGLEIHNCNRQCAVFARRNQLNQTIYVYGLPSKRSHRKPRDRSAPLPVGLLPKNKLCFTTMQGKPSYVLGVGQRSRRGSKYRYHLAPIFSVRRDLVDGYCILLRIRILITDEAGATFPSSRAVPTGSTFAKAGGTRSGSTGTSPLQFISNGGDAVTLRTGDEEVRVSSTFESFNVAFGINEDSLAKKRTKNIAC